MDTYLDEFKEVIRLCNYSNTYKMAWAKAIVELSPICMKNETELVSLSLYEIAQKMFKYYWDQTIYFNLFQSAPNQPPIILQQVRIIIELYQSSLKDYKPIVFNRAEAIIKSKFKEEYQKAINSCISNIKQNVMEFFLNYNGIKYEFYKIDKRNNVIVFERKNLTALAFNMQDLFDLINYRWSLMLEDYNSSPRIGKKVRIIDEQCVRRKNLIFFDKFLDFENKDHICFVCGNEIESDELSRDHVIPWSYMYSDDLWNLVYVHKRCNSEKSNTIPDDKTIDKLKNRNLRLQQELHEVWLSSFGTKNKKILEELDFAIENNYVDKFYLGSRGC